MKRTLVVASLVALALVSCGGESAEEKACLAAGGKVTTASCCSSQPVFPALCMLGPCSCSPTGSVSRKVCQCPTGMCFNGSECVATAN